MRRSILFILLFILLGASVNVAVSWACSVFGRPDPITKPRVMALRSGDPRPEGWSPPRPITPRSTGRCDEWYVERWFGFRKTCFVRGSSCSIPPEGRMKRYVTLEVLMSGFPMASFSGQHTIERTLLFSRREQVRPRTSYDEHWQWAHQVSCFADPANPRHRPVLPLRPLWFGVAVNTLFYAGALWLPLAGPFTLRQRLRRYYGHCPSCGYDLLGDLHAGCPECGWGRAAAVAGGGKPT